MRHQIFDERGVLAHEVDDGQPEREPPVRLQRVVRARQHHVLKCWPEPFNAIGERRKLFELRIDDRDFQEGDSCELREWNPEMQDYTQRWIFLKIGYVLREPFKFPGVKPGFCVWSIILPANHQWPITQCPNDPSSPTAADGSGGAERKL